MRTISIIIAGLALIAASTPARAHHAFSTEFDATRAIVFTGKVVKVELINPHSWIHVEVENEDGTKTTWMVEGGSPNALLRRGIDRNTVPIGSELVVDGYGSRDGANRMVGVDVKFTDGRPLFLGGTQRDNN